VRRRYSEFASLRDALTRLHPTLIVPPIPEKHTMADYAANPTNAKQDQQIIDLRKRMLAVFLNRCRRMDEIRTDGVWWRFLDPNASWVCRVSECAVATTNCLIERGLTLSSRVVNSQVDLESASAGPRKPNSRTQLLANPGSIGKAQDSGWYQSRQ
jgi:hypothetical protein